MCERVSERKGGSESGVCEREREEWESGSSAQSRSQRNQHNLRPSEGKEGEVRHDRAELQANHAFPNPSHLGSSFWPWLVSKAVTQTAHASNEV